MGDQTAARFGRRRRIVPPVSIMPDILNPRDPPHERFISNPRICEDKFARLARLRQEHVQNWAFAVYS